MEHTDAEPTLPKTSHEKRHSVIDPIADSENQKAKLQIVNPRASDNTLIKKHSKEMPEIELMGDFSAV